MLISWSVKRSMEAVDNPAVQAAAAVLAEHGLGVFVPHMHTEEMDFAELPENLVTVERDCVVTFVPRADATGVPVGWVAKRDGMKVTMLCVAVCTPIHNQTHGEIHKKGHGS